jgi:hypothetical protein
MSEHADQHEPTNLVALVRDQPNHLVNTPSTGIRASPHTVQQAGLHPV